MKTHLDLIIAALLAFSLPASGQTTLTLSTPVTMTMTAAVTMTLSTPATLTTPMTMTMTMAAEPPPPPPPRTIADWNALFRNAEGDLFRHVQNARDSNLAMHNLADDPADASRLELHSELLIERLIGCIAEALAIKGRELWLARDIRAFDWHLANSYAVKAVAFFGEQTSLAWEREIIREVVRLSTLPPHDPGRIAGYEALKETFAPLEISARGGTPKLIIGDEMPRTMMAGCSRFRNVAVH